MTTPSNTGDDVNGAPFSTLPLDPRLLEALAFAEFTHMTPVQQESLPSLLNGDDVIVKARTGSGKTAAFGLALLSRIDVDRAEVQALVLCPTRELADQVTTEIRRLARFVPNVKMVTLCGGVPVRTQTPSLVHAPHIVVGTPGRILDHLRRETFVLDGVRAFVLDEADRMLEMGFAKDIDDVVQGLPKDRQTLLFSATYPDEIRALSRRMLRTPVEITVDAEEVSADIEERFYLVDGDRRIDALHALLSSENPESALIFCHTKNDTREVARALSSTGYAVLALHGDLDQRQRDEVLIRFSNGSCTVLVATDVAARGLDVKGLAAVISYEVATDPDQHTHRIGRTGRAGATGKALALCTTREKARVTALEERRGVPAQWAKLPTHARMSPPAPAPMVTLVIDAGRQEKLRKGDVLGALTGDIGLDGAAVGKIDVTPRRTYVAVRVVDADRALKGLRAHKIKGRSHSARRLTSTHGSSEGH